MSNTPFEGRPVDNAGRLYGRAKALPDYSIAQCGAGTPGGELLRRYWQPLALTRDAGTFPRAVKILGEELILYRDGSGRAGLLYPRCMHRGTSLLFGKVEVDGIRCCYHGWKFDAEGRLVDMACEKLSAARAKNVRQPWYPVVEKFGMIFTYMGPPEKQPLFPRFSITETLADDEELVATGGIGDTNLGDAPFMFGTDYNWWNAHDNIIDPFHVYFLHSSLNGIQLVDTWKILPQVRYERTTDGVRSLQFRDLGDGRIHLRVGQSFMPNIGGVGAVNNNLGQSGIAWIVAVDDTNHRNFMLSKIKRGADPNAAFFDTRMGSGQWGPRKPAREWTLRDRQQWQSDYEAQKGQGDISLHSEEHLSAILDGGLIAIRKLFKKQTQIVAEGGDPIGATFDEPYLYTVTSGNGILDKATMGCIAGWDGRVELDDHSSGDTHRTASVTGADAGMTKSV